MIFFTLFTPGPLRLVHNQSGMFVGWCGCWNAARACFPKSTRAALECELQQRCCRSSAKFSERFPRCPFVRAVDASPANSERVVVVVVVGVVCFCCGCGFVSPVWCLVWAVGRRRRPAPSGQGQQMASRRRWAPFKLSGLGARVCARICCHGADAVGHFTRSAISDRRSADLD